MGKQNKMPFMHYNTIALSGTIHHKLKKKSSFFTAVTLIQTNE